MVKMSITSYEMFGKTLLKGRINWLMSTLYLRRSLC